MFMRQPEPSNHRPWLLVFSLLIVSYLLSPVSALWAAPPQPQNAAAKPPADHFQPDPRWKPLAKDLWFDPAQRQLVMRAKVVLREGALEHLLCLRHTKEHEAILATEAPPQMIHAGLLLTGVEPGQPVQFRPEFQPPKGPAITIELRWEQDGKARSAPARDWVQDQASGKALAKDWVFVGSMTYEDPVTKKTHYAAEDGDLITVANFPAAILDVPFASTSADAERSFVAFTERIPPIGTPVTMILRPVKPPKPPTATPR
jgi:hypothetical protein